MEKRMLWLGLMIMVVGLCSSGALATVMGPPAAGLDAGQFRIGIDNSSSETGVEGEVKWSGQHTYKGVLYDSAGDKVASVSDSSSWEGRDDISDKIQSEMIFANLGYGVFDKLEVFLRFGLSDLNSEDGDLGKHVDEIAYGFGVKATIYEEGKVKLGALVQMSKFNFGGEFYGEEYIDMGDGKWVNTTGEWELDYYQIKFAVGPTYELNEVISIYGGPFFQIVDGEIDVESSGEKTVTTDVGGGFEAEETYRHQDEYSADIGQQSRYGLYIGALINCGENFPVCVEYQRNLLLDNEQFSASLAYRF